MLKTRGLLVLLAVALLTLAGVIFAVPAPVLSPIAALGEKAFNDPGLSASNRQACASCHAAAAGHAPPNGLAVQLGGPNLTIQGLRASPGLDYLASNAAFHFDEEGTPTGGFFLDGRADSLAAQAAGPLLNAREMANPDKAAVVRKIGRASWVEDFKKLYGENILSDADSAFDRLTEALARYQVEDKSFNSFTSKYDEFLRKQVSLSEQEARGLKLFNEPEKGNCAACHTSEIGADGTHPLFTDFTYDNLGVPRSSELVVNQAPDYFDLGLCGRADLQARSDLCGAFKVPSLRNVALRKTYFHNGKFNSLKDVVTFYVQRDTAPEQWYPLNPDGTVNKFDDLPASFHENVNTSEAPYGLKPGEQPALSEPEVDDVVAFLNTLTDGWKAP